MKVTAKDILGWVKSHIVIVLSVLVILAVIPVAFVFSTGWLQKIVKSQEEAANKELTAVRGADIEYRLRQFDPSAPTVSEKGAPNAALIQHFRKANERLAGEATAAAEKGVNFNRGSGPEAAALGRTEFRPLVDGLFPKPVLTEEQAKSANAADFMIEQEAIRLNEMEDALLGKRGRPNPYAQVLAIARAGGPVDATRLEEVIRDARSREVERITSNSRGLTEEETTRLVELMQNRRLAELQARARSIGVYATVESLPGGGGGATPGGPRGSRERRGGGGQQELMSEIARDRIDPADLTRPKLFMKQWDLWLLSDLFTAVRLANESGGTPVGVDKGVVKRIESIQLPMPEGFKGFDPEPASEDSFGTDTGEAAPPSDVAGMVPLDKSRSITGRVRGGWNELYEVRRVRVSCVVSSARINEFLAVIARTNYMSVTDLDLAEVDSWEALQEGFYYGDEHVVRATLEIETIWLKSWLLPLMPDELRTSLGMKVEQAASPM